MRKKNLNPVAKLPVEVHEPTDENRALVRRAVAVGITQALIASYLDIGEKTLRKHYRKELDDGLTEVIIKVGSSLIERALAGERTESIFFLKTRAGWSEKIKSEISGPDGEPLKAGDDVDYVAELSRRLERLAQSQNDGAAQEPAANGSEETSE